MLIIIFGRYHYKIEIRDLILVDSLNIVEETVKKLENVQEKIGEIINTKVKMFYKKILVLHKRKLSKIFLLVILLKFDWM